MDMNWDWTKQYSTEGFEEDLGLTFNGPGLYLTETDTILVIPGGPRNAPTVDNIWDSNQPEGTLWNVYCWNTKFENTLLGAKPPPNRLINRITD